MKRYICYNSSLSSCTTGLLPPSPNNIWKGDMKNRCHRFIGTTWMRLFNSCHIKWNQQEAHYVAARLYICLLLHLEAVLIQVCQWITSVICVGRPSYNGHSPKQQHRYHKQQAWVGNRNYRAMTIEEERVGYEQEGGTMKSWSQHKHYQHPSVI
ncbi:hypothetical protein BCR42DRAFT_398978 [Absidia repens]|uniref:Uncharacterized protein n=1 Tax=Absidia repens TaxID=90262 RepID=A0A1X2HKI2_9FUNG|nr:hypothetical protein BCR42DRAFT_398978 [Absidia repens]